MSKKEFLGIMATDPFDRSVDGKRKCLVNQQPTMEDPAKLVSAEEVIDRLAKRNDLKKIQEGEQEINNDTQAAPAAKGKSLDGMKMPMNPSLAVKCLDKVIPTRKVDNELRNHDYKLTQETSKEMRDKFKVKIALKSCMKEDILKEHCERKESSESAYERKSEGCNVKLVNENLRSSEVQMIRPKQETQQNTSSFVGRQISNERKGREDDADLHLARDLLTKLLQLQSADRLFM